MKRSTHCGIRCAVLFWAIGFFGIPQIGAATIYVSTAGSDANDGLTWPTAKLTVQAGLNAAASGDQVWVAAGTYVENITLKSGVALYGGFAGTEADLSQRNWTTNVTILDGNQAASVVTAPSGVTQTTRIDGFTIRNGRANSGGGVCCSNAAPTIANNTITGNSAVTSNGYGGGIYCDLCASTIAGNTITGNSAYNGGGIYSKNSSPTITNSTIVGNSALSGGGVYCDGPSSPTIVDTIVAFNSSGVYKYSGAGALSLRYNCVHGNPGGNYLGVGDPTGTNGNISSDPRLASATYGNFHLQPDSPCIDAGDDSVVQPGWVDLDGQPRIIGAHVDIGADESDGTLWPTGPNAIVRVTPSGNDANDGSSWSLAKRTVQVAIDAVAVSGGEVWVAAGTYVERISLRNFTHVYGGFAGTETDLSQRNWSVNLTVLDGSQGGTVVTASGLGYLVSTIDGFVIRNGSSRGIGCSTASPSIANNTITGNSGRGVYCTYSCATITNNTISDNGDSGIYCNYSSLTIAHNTISGNSADAGGAIACYQSSSATSIVNNSIVGNSSYADGGGIYSSYSSPMIANNAIVANACGGGGGGIYCLSSTIANNTIAGNVAGKGGGIYCNAGSPVIANTIVAFNSTGIYNAQGGGTPSLRHNCVFGNAVSNYSGKLIDPTGTNGNIASDPALAGLSYGNVHIQPSSSCLDAGDDTLAPSGSVDMDGQPRIMGSHVDIGADESNGTVWAPGPCVIVRVSQTGDDSNDGSSWALTKRTVQRAIDTAAATGGEVWVQAGTYTECITLPNFAHVYGGFAGAESERSARNWSGHPTILDGNKAGSVVTVVGGYRLSTIDGFTIRNGTGANRPPYLRGGGIYGFGASPTIANNTIRQNTATLGGGIYTEHAFPLIVSNTISANSATSIGGAQGGGGIFCTQANPTIVNNIITGNTASYAGGGINCGNGSMVVANNMIAGNTAVYIGGGIYCYWSSAAVAACTIAANSAPGGAGIYGENSSGTVTNAIIAFNSSGIYGKVGTLRYNCVYGNTAYNFSGLTDPTGTNGNISADPRFVSATPGPDGIWGTADDTYADLRLLPGSPCIDAGNNADVPPGILTDLGGFPRFLDDPATPDCQWAPGTCGTPPIVDMGAYEFAADSDGDGVPDFLDDCPASDLGQTIVINGVNTGVPNQSLGDGCTMADETAKLAAGAANHGAFVNGLDQLTDSWVTAGLITDAQKGRIQSVAGRSRIPGDINADGFVDASDLLILAGSFGKLVGDSAPDAGCDLNFDGAVDVSDLLILAGNWGV